MFVSQAEACKRLGLCAATLRKYEKNGKIKARRTEGGWRRYDVDAYFADPAATKTIIYARVSSAKQKDDLHRQVKRLSDIYPEAEVISDIGSGLNYSRKGLLSLLGRAVSGEKLTVVVTYRDRLCRFGFELIEAILESVGGKVVVLDAEVDKSSEEEMCADVLAILHYFSCKLHGKRSHKVREDSSIPDQGSETDLKTMVRGFKIRVQSYSSRLKRAKRDTSPGWVDEVESSCPGADS